jgi:mRNA interferase RelE/StbE
MSHPQYRLRVDDIRVFYDVSDETVEILAIITKAQADAWLHAAGDPIGGDEE